MYKSSTVDSVASPAHGVGTDSGLNDRESVGLDEAVGKLLQAFGVVSFWSALVKSSYDGIPQNVLSSGDSTEEEKMLLLAAVLEDEENLGVIFTKPALRMFNTEPQLRYTHTQRKMAQDGRWKNCPGSNRRKHSVA
uniref:Uncharacterized protein n=1 Tax=Timema cristinae TaxID=61476 RepID=A0A7R9CGI2_TIMCR|nr:unnamed protein product [Timema cristinae]